MSYAIALGGVAGVSPRWGGQRKAARHGARTGSVAQGGSGAGIPAGEPASFSGDAFGLGNPQVSILAPGGVVDSVIKVRVDYFKVRFWFQPYLSAPLYGKGYGEVVVIPTFLYSTYGGLEESVFLTQSFCLEL